jgi:hypothetical protein
VSFYRLVVSRFHPEHWGSKVHRKVGNYQTTRFPFPDYCTFGCTALKKSHFVISCLCLFTQFNASEGDSFGVTKSRKSAPFMYAISTCLPVPPHVETEERLKEFSRNISTQLIWLKIECWSRELVATYLLGKNASDEIGKKKKRRHI